MGNGRRYSPGTERIIASMPVVVGRIKAELEAEARVELAVLRKVVAQMRRVPRKLQKRIEELEQVTR